MESKPACGLHRLTFAFSLPMLLDLSILEHYSAHLDRRTSINQYFHGVYASRVLGRELVLAFANSFNWIGKTFWNAKSSGLMIGWVLTNGISFMVASLLLYRLSVGRNARLVVPYVTIIVVMAASANVLTPYDALSYVLIIAVFDRAHSRDTWSAIGLMILATATRESALLVVPLMMATLVDTDAMSSLNTRGRARCLARTFWSSQITVSLALTGVLTYAALKLLPLMSAHRFRLVQHVGVSGHLSVGGAVGSAIAVVLVLAVRISLRGAVDRTRSKVLRWVFWVSATPYLVVCCIWGIWAEAPRLVMPMLLGEFLILTSSEARQPSPARTVRGECLFCKYEA